MGKCKMAILLCLMAWTVQAQIRVSEWPEGKEGLKRNPDYEVYVKPLAGSDSEWRQVPNLDCEVDVRKVRHASFAEFEMGGPVAVKVRNCRADALGADGRMAVKVKPASRGIVARQVDERTVEFALQRPEFLSVEFNGERKQNLHVFANAMLTETYTGDEPGTINWTAPNAQDIFMQDARLIYFGPGVHKPKDLPSGEIKIPSHTTVYLAPGAVARARLIVDRAEDVRIIGRGIIAHPLRGIEITYSKDVLVDGVTVLNPQHYTVYGGQSENITIRNLKSFSARPWSDGIDLMCCRHVKIHNVFLRNSDDCIALYNHRWWYWGGSSDFDISRATLWCDWAHPVNIGTHGDDRSETGETLENVRIHDCDILFHAGDGMLTIGCGDKNTIRDVTYDSIRIEDVPKARLFEMRVDYSEKYNRAPGNRVENVRFRNISVTAPEGNINPSLIIDYDKQRSVGGYTLENVTVNGRPFRPETDVVRTMTVK